MPVNFSLYIPVVSNTFKEVKIKFCHKFATCYEKTADFWGCFLTIFLPIFRIFPLIFAFVSD